MALREINSDAHADARVTTGRAAGPQQSEDFRTVDGPRGNSGAHTVYLPTRGDRASMRDTAIQHDTTIHLYNAIQCIGCITTPQKSGTAWNAGGKKMAQEIRYRPRPRALETFRKAVPTSWSLFF